MRWVQIGSYEYEYEDGKATGRYRHVMYPEDVMNYLEV